MVFGPLKVNHQFMTCNYYAAENSKMMGKCYKKSPNETIKKTNIKFSWFTSEMK